MKNRKELCKKSKLIDELGMKLQHFQWQINDINKEKQMKIKKYFFFLFFFYKIKPSFLFLNDDCWIKHIFININKIFLRGAYSNFDVPKSQPNNKINWLWTFCGIVHIPDLYYYTEQKSLLSLIRKVFRYILSTLLEPILAEI